MVSPAPLSMFFKRKKRFFDRYKSHPITPEMFTQNRKPRIHLLSVAMASISGIFLLVFFIYISPMLDFISTVDVVESSSVVEQACKATRFSSVCKKTIASLPAKSSPQDVILASIASSVSSLATARSIAKAILDVSSDDINRTNAAKNCIDLLRYSKYRLDQASPAVSASKTDDAMAWTSAALLFQYDCFSALKYVNGTKQVDDAMWFLISLQDLTSNALSLMFSYRRFGGDFSKWSPPLTERDGYYWSGSGSSAPVGGGVSFPPDLKKNYNAMVCRNRREIGCFKTVQEAVDSAPEFSGKRFVIYIPAGVYKEIVRVPLEKTNLVFIGDGMGKTVITGSLNHKIAGVTTYNTATVAANGDGFMAKDLTFENNAGPDGQQAVAFRSDSDFSVFVDVEFLGYQDTLYAHSLRQYYKSCRIAGTVDYIFGNSASVFEDCQLLIRTRLKSPEKGESNPVTAHGRTDPAQSTGFVFRNCTVDGTPDYLAVYKKKPAKHRNYLGRPWKEYSRTVFLECHLAEIVTVEGWKPWSGDFALSTLFYGEYRNSGPGANAAKRVSWSNQIPADQISSFSLQNFIQGDTWIPSSNV